ncbi:MAG: glycosyltransferase family 8 protein [Muricoprocola sp.]
MNILFTINRGYLEHLEDCIRSILRFPSADGYDIYIMHSDLQSEDEMQLGKLADDHLKLHFIYIDPENNMDFPETDRYPIEIYYRIFAAFLLPDTLERVLYLDADTLVINPLTELYHMDFDGNYILACTHVRKALNKVNQIRLGIKDERPYINSGVMLMNLKELRKHQNIQEVTDYVEKYKNVLTLPDQDIITALYGDKVGLLDTMRYNLSDRMLAFYNADITHKKIDLDWVRKNAVIIHYYGKQKPWNKGYHGILNVFYEEMKE